jgi:hypothetical protein
MAYMTLLRRTLKSPLPSACACCFPHAWFVPPARTHAPLPNLPTAMLLHAYCLRLPCLRLPPAAASLPAPSSCPLPAYALVFPICSRPENPWALLLGVIHVGPDLGLGIYGIMVPPLCHVTQQHLQKLPGCLQRQFPAAKSIALAGRLPSMMAAAGKCGQAGGVWRILSAGVMAVSASVQAAHQSLTP